MVLECIDLSPLLSPDFIWEFLSLWEEIQTPDVLPWVVIGVIPVFSNNIFPLCIYEVFQLGIIAKSIPDETINLILIKDRALLPHGHLGFLNGYGAISAGGFALLAFVA